MKDATALPPDDSTMHHPNRLLASLPANVLLAVYPCLTTKPLRLDDVLAEMNGEVSHVFFPHDGLISLVVETDDGNLIETAMIGNDGAMGAAAALDCDVSLDKAIVQVRGMASLISAPNALELARVHDEFRSPLFRYERLLLAQAQQAAACNACHTLEERLCKRLLQMKDFTRTDLPVTHDLLGRMIGARRPSITTTLNNLQRAGPIECRHGFITIVDEKRLKDASCKCHRLIKSRYKSMLRRPSCALQNANAR